MIPSMLLLYTFRISSTAAAILSFPPGALPHCVSLPSCFLQATLRSTVQIVNGTDLALDVRALCSAWLVDPFDALDTASGMWQPLSTHRTR